MTTDHDYMQRALALAQRGQGYVEPNPMVGAVVVADGRIIGEGWHERYGQAHAEVHALQAAGPAAFGSTLYVTLEPCCHFGKTPPCTNAVIQAGVRRVVVAMLDPFPQVAGQGVSRLREAGIAVEVGVCEVAAHHLNAPYLLRLRAEIPWVHAKWAMTVDGKIATTTGESQWITGELARRRVHELRGRMDAILVGRGTLVADDPLLTARPAGPRTPTRLVVTQSGALPATCRLLQTLHDAPVLVATHARMQGQLMPWVQQGAEVIGLDATGPAFIAALLRELGQRRMTNILLEGGAGLLGSFLEANAIHEVHAFIAPKILGGLAPTPIAGAGIPQLANALAIEHWHVEQLGADVLLTGRTKSAAFVEHRGG